MLKKFSYNHLPRASCREFLAPDSFMWYEIELVPKVSDNDLSICRSIWREVRTSDARERWIREPGKQVTFTIQYGSHKLDLSHSCFELLYGRIPQLRMEHNNIAFLLLLTLKDCSHVTKLSKFGPKVIIIFDPFIDWTTVADGNNISPNFDDGLNFFIYVLPLLSRFFYMIHVPGPHGRIRFRLMWTNFCNL